MSSRNCLFLVLSEITEKIIILKHYSASLNYIKIMEKKLQYIYKKKTFKKKTLA